MRKLGNRLGRDRGRCQGLPHHAPRDGRGPLQSLEQAPAGTAGVRRCSPAHVMTSGMDSTAPTTPLLKRVGGVPPGAHAVRKPAE